MDEIVSFFPQLIQGPISRNDELSPSLYAEHRYDWRNVKFGLQRVLWGFFKKLVIADRILVAVNTIIKAPDDHRGVYVLVGMLFYAFQLYADFTGGIDITIGIAEMLGIKVAENFNAPFLAKNITDYWRRWHITMGTWFMGVEGGRRWRSGGGWWERWWGRAAGRVTACTS